MHELREMLYPFGFLASFLFAGRFLFQWMESEWKKRSVVSPTFWKLSLTGNISLLIHAMIQGQLPIVFFQAVNGVISWRNLNLNRPVEQRASTKILPLFFAGAIITSISTYIVVQKFFDGIHWEWFRIPKTPWQEEVKESSLVWDCTGFIGYAIFSSRFWIQWWHAEKKQASHVTPFFWWYSLIGGMTTALYFAKIGDIVQFIGPALGLIPYARNLIFLRKKNLPHHERV